MVACGLLVVSVLAQPQAVSVGNLTGTVTDESGAALVQAHVVVSRIGGNLSRTAVTDGMGRFLLARVIPGRYVVRVEAPGFKPSETIVEISGRSAPTLAIVLSVQSAEETVTVEGGAPAVETSARAHTDIPASLTVSLPDTAVNGGFSKLLTLGTPGVAAESNGGFHPLGEHAEVAFSIDGQPITDQQSRTFSNQVSLNTVQSVDVIHGAPPAEFGDKTSMIVRAITRSGLGAGPPRGSLTFGYGTFGTANADFSLSTSTSKFGNFVAADGLNSNRFLDTPEFVPLHANGNAENFFDRFDLQPTHADSLHFNIVLSRSWFQTPNTYDQQTNGQDQRQLMRSTSIAAAYSHVFSPSWLLDANIWWRGDHIDYYPSANVFADAPATFSQDRTLQNAGLKVDLSYSKGRHNLKTGVATLWTPLKESFAAGLTDSGFNSPCVDQQGVPVPDATLTNPAQCSAHGDLSNGTFEPALLPYDLTRGGRLFAFSGNATIREQSAYVQDSITFRRLAINPGLRLDHYDGISQSTALQPRAGLSYQLPKIGAVLRASYARIMVTPYNENLILSSFTGPGGLAGGALGTATVTPLAPGRRNQFNLGLAQAIGRKVNVDAEYFWKFTDGAFDFNVLLNTPLNFPIQFRQAKIDGLMARINVADTHGLSAFIVLGHTRSRLFSPEVGGINFGVQYAPVARPDHDQAFQQTTFVRYQPTAHAPWLGFTWRYDSGLVAVAVPDYVTALTLTGDEQAQMGLYCGTTLASVTSPLRTCMSPKFGATRVHIVPVGTYDPDKNPSRIVPRSLFDVAAGWDNIWHREHYHVDGKVTVTNLTGKSALYNFLSSFSGTHFITPRAIQAEMKIRF